MAKTSKPREGSLAYKPAKRAKTEVPRIRNWPESSEKRLLGFAGYKAGMTNVIAIDNRKDSRTAGLETFLATTVIEVPPVKAYGARIYKKGYEGLEIYTEENAQELDEELEKRIKIKAGEGINRIKEAKEELGKQVADIRLLVHTQPKLTPIPKKKPELMEMGLGGTIEEKLEFAEEKLGDEIKVSEVFSENQLTDVTAVSKGKGYQGIIKRYGLMIQPRKAGKGRRHMGTGGAWVPSRKMWREPLPGQMGYHTRTEYNKAIIKISENPEEINPTDGFGKYGKIKNEYVLVKGSVPGPSKRLIRLTYPKRAQGKVNYDITHINTQSKQK